MRIKICIIAMVFIIVFGLVACNGKEEETSQPIALDANNIGEYITFNVSYADFNTSKLSIAGLTTYSATAYKTIEAYSTKDALYDDVIIRISCDTLDVWTEDIIEIRLSSSGTGKATALIKYESVVKPSTPQYSGEYTIESVTGTATIKN